MNLLVGAANMNAALLEIEFAAIAIAINTVILWFALTF
jgi:hypothetical protein